MLQHLREYVVVGPCGHVSGRSPSRALLRQAVGWAAERGHHGFRVRLATGLEPEGTCDRCSFSTSEGSTERPGSTVGAEHQLPGVIPAGG